MNIEGSGEGGRNEGWGGGEGRRMGGGEGGHSQAGCDWTEIVLGVAREGGEGWGLGFSRYTTVVPKLMHAIIDASCSLSHKKNKK